MPAEEQRSYSQKFLMQADGPELPAEVGLFPWKSAGNCELFLVHSLAPTFTTLEGFFQGEESIQPQTRRSSERQSGVC